MSLFAGHKGVHAPKEARKQVHGIFVIRDQQTRDLLAAWAAACPTRTLSVWRCHKDGRNTVKVSINGGPGRCIRQALEFIARLGARP